MTTVSLILAHDLHARPVAAFSSAATASGATVLLGRPGAEPINADNMLQLMSADFHAGERVELTVDGPHTVLAQLTAMLMPE